MKIIPVILSGGSGSRLWPLSREQYPKQLLPLASNNTLLQETALRVSTGVDKQVSVADPIIVCNEQHRFLVAEQLRQLGITTNRILLEPMGRNTAPALTLAAIYCEEVLPDSVLLIMPADHIIENNDEFIRSVSLGLHYAKSNALLTFGVVPSSAETGYGYIKMGRILDLPAAADQSNTLNAHKLEKFVEKPNQETAQKYVDSGEFLWNSGMFMMKSSTWLDALQHFNLEMLQQCQKAYDDGQQDLDFYRIGADAFSSCPNDSIDYAVMEKLTSVADNDNYDNQRYSGVVVPLACGWSDVGAWSSLWEVGDQDVDGNVVSGDVLLQNVKSSMVKAEHRLVAAVGLSDIIVIETADAILVANKQNSQDVKKIVDILKIQERDERVYHRQVYRPWGSYEGVVAGDRFQVKRIIVNPGASLSLQMHHHRAEHWIVVKGTAKVTRGEDTFLISENESTYIPLGTTHRLENPGTLPLEIIEVQSGSYLGEDDIVRFEDNYGRGENSGGNNGST